MICKADCVHRHDSTSTTQLRGAQRQDLIQSATRAPASLHANASAGRSSERQLSGDVSTSGGTPQVVRQATYEARASECRFDKDVLYSVMLRNRKVEAADLEGTALDDRKLRLWTGDAPYFLIGTGGNFTLMLMTDHQLQLWVHLRQQGYSGWFMDATEGMVSQSCVNGKLLHLNCAQSCALHGSGSAGDRGSEGPPILHSSQGWVGKISCAGRDHHNGQVEPCLSWPSGIH